MNRMLKQPQPSDNRKAQCGFCLSRPHMKPLEDPQGLQHGNHLTVKSFRALYCSVGAPTGTNPWHRCRGHRDHQR